MPYMRKGRGNGSDTSHGFPMRAYKPFGRTVGSCKRIRPQAGTFSQVDYGFGSESDLAEAVAGTSADE